MIPAADGGWCHQYRSMELPAVFWLEGLARYFILWLAYDQRFFLVHLAYQLYRGIDITRNGKPLRLFQLASLLYATAWTLIVMLVFGAEVLLPLDFLSLYVTISLMHQLWRSPQTASLETRNKSG